MRAQAVRTGVFSKGMSLTDFILKSVKGRLKEKSVLAVTSKIISLAEGRTVHKQKISKQDLVRREADYYLAETAYGSHLTVKHGHLAPSAGIDESNSEEGKYILYPADPFASAEKTVKAIKQQCSLKEFAVVITDSRTLPLRRGVVGSALAYSGFKGLKSLIGQKDLFGRPLRMTAINLADALAVTAVLLMGEGAEQCPLAVMYDAPVVFTNSPVAPKELSIPVSEDLYRPLYKDLLP